MEIDRLLDHSDWVRNLAFNLVNDPDEAEDLVQDTWAAALESPPRDVASSRSWLARVLRNFAYSSFRRRQRRRSRERVAAVAEAIPSPEASIEKLEITRLLIDLVFALEEPGRTAVVLRYFEGLTSKEIARRLDTSPRWCEHARGRVRSGGGHRAPRRGCGDQLHVLGRGRARGRDGGPRGFVLRGRLEPGRVGCTGGRRRSRAAILGGPRCVSGR